MAKIRVVCPKGESMPSEDTLNVDKITIHYPAIKLLAVQGIKVI